MTMSFDDFDELHHGENRESAFSRMVDKAISRRNFLHKSAVIGLGAFATASVAGHAQASPGIGFTPVAANSLDTITLPQGYSYQVLISWGDPLLAGEPAFNQQTRGTATSQALAFGDNNDGMELFPLSADRAILAVNNEYTNLEWILASGSIHNSDDVQKNKYAHGLSIFEIRKDGKYWRVVPSSSYNRRITPDTPMAITGEARGHALLTTSYDSSATVAKGTWNNCGSGATPWGTYLTCEENFNGYFASSDENLKISREYARYGIGKEDWGYGWYTEDPRFDIAKEPNEPNKAGYIVEIDPYNPKSVPKKRTSLGRFKHENAELVVNRDGRVVVYMGDDERGEYLYKFVSDGKVQGNDRDANMDLLEKGTLYVAQFGQAGTTLSGSGRWIPLVFGQNGLTPANGFRSQADIQVFTRMAATQVGATTMDRPEWVAAHPHQASVYCALTNNKQRGNKKNKGGVEQLVNGPNPRENNNYGQIVHWTPKKGDHTSNEFEWNLFVIAGNPMVQDGLYAGSDNITKENMFNSPDGLFFDQDGRLWIQTDGKYSNSGEFAGMGNNQMLCADTANGEIRRFMVGPIACEVTGATLADGGRTMFVGIQHPGEAKQESHFPDGGQTVPRSSIVMITKDDGGIIGT